LTHEEKEKAAAFRRGVEQFNAREFWEAHESWELVWLPAPEPDKTFLQGIIQVSAGFYHFTESNLAGARSLLRRGLAKLERCPGDYRGLRLEELRVAARAWLAALDGGAATPAAFPQIHNAAAAPRKK
jgi:predicted metal-dependent hydrolase